MHLDHIAALPWLTEKLEYCGPICASPPTEALGERQNLFDVILTIAGGLMLADFLWTEEGAAGPYGCSADDAARGLSKIKALQPGERVALRPRNVREILNGQKGMIEIQSMLSGHVIGALAFHVSFAGMSVQYTGKKQQAPLCLMSHHTMRWVSCVQAITTPTPTT
jgi:Cft2 family RNA processing exonuclease